MRIVYGLNTGDRLTVADTQMRRWSRELGTRVRKCTVIHEYPHFILADFGAYRESINKASIHCKAVLIWKGWEEERRADGTVRNQRWGIELEVQDNDNRPDAAICKTDGYFPAKAD